MIIVSSDDSAFKYDHSPEKLSKRYGQTPVLIERSSEWSLYCDSQGNGEWEERKVAKEDVPPELLDVFDPKRIYLLYLSDEATPELNEGYGLEFTPAIADFIQGRHAQTLGGGSAVVYMERLLTILRKARSLKEQLHCLNKLVLTAKGPYYAMLRGYLAVSYYMDFNCDPDQEDQYEFSATRSPFDIQLNTYVKMSEEDPYQAFALACRVLGLQPSGIDLPSFIDLFLIKRSFLGSGMKDWNLFGLLQSHDAKRVRKYCAALLPFISHGAYKNPYLEERRELTYSEHSCNKNEYNFFDLNRIIQQKENDLFYECIEFSSYLCLLEQAGIRLSLEEGLLIYNQYLKETSQNTEMASSLRYRFFILLRDDKHSVLQALKSTQRPLDEIIETAEYLEEKEPYIQQKYRSHLLIFSALIYYYENRGRQCGYFHGISHNVENVITKKGKGWEHLEPKKVTTINPIAKPLIAALARIKQFIVQAAQSPQPNNLDSALKSIVRSRRKMTYDACIAAFTEIAALAVTDAEAVEVILQRRCPIDIKTSLGDNDFYYGFGSGMHEHSLFVQTDIRELHCKVSQYYYTLQSIDLNFTEKDFLDHLTAVKQSHQPPHKLDLTSTSILLRDFQETWQRTENSPGLVQQRAVILHTVLEYWMKAYCSAVHPDLLPKMKKMLLPKNFLFDHFRAIKTIGNQVKEMTDLLFSLSQKSGFIEAFLKSCDYRIGDYPHLLTLLHILARFSHQMSAQNLLHIFEAFNRNRAGNKLPALLEVAAELYNVHHPAQDIANFLDFYARNLSNPLLPNLKRQLLELHGKKNEIARFILDYLTLPFHILNKISDLAIHLNENSHAITILLKSWDQGKYLIELVTQLGTVKPEKAFLILDILAKCHLVSRKEDYLKANYGQLIVLLDHLLEVNLQRLHEFSKTTAPSLICLKDGLKREMPPFEDLLNSFEKNPFGDRDLKKQFSETELERIVNGMRDLTQDSALPSQARQELIELFRGINAAGYRLPIYRGKPAIELSNLEIQKLIQSCKQDMLTEKTFDRAIYVIPLLREAMYRSTNQFPYLNQIIALLNSLMHQRRGDQRVLENIDTGQGKSLIDAMKASLLYQQGTHIRITAPSLIDAKRDCELYLPYFSLIGQPCLPYPLASNSSLKDAQEKGNAYTTVPDCALLHMKAELKNTALIHEGDVWSLVLTESDSALFNATVFRLSMNSQINLNGNEWVYDGINEFMSSVYIQKYNTRPNETHVPELLNYLRAKARMLRRSPQILESIQNNPEGNPFPMWLQSAYLLDQHLHNKIDYIASESTQIRKVYGAHREVREIQVLGEDGKIKPRVKYGNGLHALICSLENKRLKSDQFVVGTVTRTIISSTITSFIRRYPVIWGGSATVGSQVDIQRMSKLYNMRAISILPYQKMRGRVHAPVFCDGQEDHFRAILSEIRLYHRKNRKAPAFLFFENIIFLENFYRFYRDEAAKPNSRLPQTHQLFTGTGDEQKAVERAGQEGMYTFTTPVLGRNTNTLYNYEIGMGVICTHVSSSTVGRQEGGRTRRQGSEGEVYYIYDLSRWKGCYTGSPIQILHAIQTQLDQGNVRKLESNYQIFNISDSYRLRIEAFEWKGNSKTQFYICHWASFDKRLQERYCQLQRTGTFNAAKFNLAAQNDFDNLVRPHCPELPLLLEEKTVQPTELVPVDHSSYEGPVHLSDCPFKAEALAMRTLSRIEVKAEPDGIADEKSPADNNKISQDCQHFLNHLADKKLARQDLVVLVRLSQTPFNPSLRSSLRKTLADYLHDEILQIMNRSFRKRHFGSRSHLSIIADDANYLAIFQQFFIGSDLEQNTALAKKAIQALFKEYLHDRFFYINGTRRSKSGIFLTKIHDENCPVKLMEALIAFKNEITLSDLSRNLSSFWKPLHITGNSRLQNCIDQSIFILAALTQTKLTPVLPSSPNLPEVKTMDDFKQKGPTFFKHIDKHNAKVLSKSITRQFTIQSRL